MWAFFESNSRDKLALIALLLLGILAFIALYLKVETQAVAGLLGMIVTAFAGAFKGNPSPEPVSPTASTTSTVETKTSETVSDKGAGPTT